MKSSLILVLGTVLVPAVASADDNAPTSTPIVEGRIGPMVYEGHDGMLMARRIVEGQVNPLEADRSPSTEVLAVSRYIYLNKNGSTLNPGGTDNSATRTSTIVDTTRNFPAWNVSATNWSAVVAALQEMYAPFGVTVSDAPPPTGTRFIMAMFGGTAGDALPADQVPPPSQGTILGVSPFTPDCGNIDDSIVFTFAVSAEQFGETPRQIAEIAAQEIAHSFGLDHVLNASDPMTYLDYTGNRSFKSGAVPCGESTARACGLVNYGYPSCRANQDDVALLLDRLGTGGTPGDTVAPTLGITAPQNNALVPPTFTVYVDASDNEAITTVELYVDDTLVDTAVTSPFSLHATSLTLGDHVLQVVASDGTNQTTRNVSVTVDDNADPVDPPDPGNPPDDGGGDYVTGGCSAGGTGGGASLVLGLALVGLISRRRR
jgi:uncharacterized protein (TIGR03382 family)